MVLATRLALFLGVAAALSAQTLSFGEIYQTSPQTTPPTYTVDIILNSSGTAAGVQFDLQYTTSQLNVTVNAGPAATAAQAQVNTVQLSNTLSNPFCVNSGSCVHPQDNGPGQRVIVVGASLSSQTVTNNVIADGVVATLTIQPIGAGNATNEILTIPSIYIAATTAGSNTVAAANIPLTISGPNDGAGNGQINLFNTYMVGSLSPYTNNNSAPNFGSGALHITDTLLELFYQTGAPGYTLPATCTDYFDAMDSSPVDTATTRGGDGHIQITDTLTQLFRQTGAPGYSVLPVRIPRGLTCASGTTVTANARQAPTEVEVRGTLLLGPTQGAGAAQERVPVYLQGGRDLPKVAISFSIGDERSPLQFTAAPGLSPTMTYQDTPGFVTVMFASGFDVRGGDRVLLGYVAGPAGSAANLKIFGVSAATMNDMKVFGVETSGATAAR
jgi:hypothetical protein